MAPAVWRLLKFTTKALVAGGAVYVAYDYGLLGSGTQGQEVLKKTSTAVPPALHEWADYFGVQVSCVVLDPAGISGDGSSQRKSERGLLLPSTPKLDFSICESWNWGVQKSVSALSAAPTKACDSTAEGWKYVKDLVK